MRNSLCTEDQARGKKYAIPCRIRLPSADHGIIQAVSEQSLWAEVHDIRQVADMLPSDTPLEDKVVIMPRRSTYGRPRRQEQRHSDNVVF